MPLGQQVETEEKEIRNVWCSVPANSEITIIPLVNFASKETGQAIVSYKRYEFGSGKGFWTIPDTQEKGDVGAKLGFTSKDKWIMPVLVYEESTKSWSQPRYFQFGKMVFDELMKTNTGIKVYCENEKENGNNSVDGITFKGAIIKVTRDDNTSNKIPKYSTAWTFKHASKGKTSFELPENDLDIQFGIAGFNFEDDEDLNKQIIKRFESKSDFRVKLNKDDEDYVTIGELLKKHGFSSDVESEFEMSEDE